MYTDRYDRGNGLRQNKSTERKAKMPWGAIMLSFAFMFNPYISIVDPLPDFIGYIILSLSLVKLSMISEGIATAKRAFERMILIDGAKFLALLWVFGIDVASERNSSLLLWSFVFGLFEVAFLAPAFIKLFDGFSELGNFHVNVAVHGSKYINGKSHTERAKALSVFFVVFRAIMTLLPELLALGNVSYIEVSNSVNLYRYIGVVRGLCFIPTLAVGVAWLVRILRYFARIKRDKPFLASIEASYREKVIPKEGVFVIRNVNIAAYFFVAAMALTLDVKLDGQNIIPDVLVVALLIPSFVYMFKSAKVSVPTFATTSVLYLLSSIATIATHAYFDENYTYNSMARSSEAFSAYFIYVGSVAVQGIIFICLLAAWCKFYKKVIADHTGYVKGKEVDSDGERAHIAEVHSEIGKGFGRMLDVAIVYVLSDIALALYGAIYAFMNKNFAWLGLLNLVFGFFFVITVLRALGELRDAVQIKYMLE